MVIAIAPLLGTLHRAFTRHAVCEHGDLIELISGEEPAGSGENVGVARAPSQGATAMWAGSATATHAHTHCSVGTLVRASGATVAEAELVAPCVERAATAIEARTLDCAKPVLANAPKTSPPA